MKEVEKEAYLSQNASAGADVHSLSLSLSLKQ